MIQMVICRVSLASPTNDTNGDPLSEWGKLVLESMNSWEVRENRSILSFINFTFGTLRKRTIEYFY